MNIINYAKRETRDFSQLEFGQVDSLILAQLAYLDYSTYFSTKESLEIGHTIESIYKSVRIDPAVRNTFEPKLNTQLVEAMAGNPRYKDIRLVYYIDELSTEKEFQFSAITYLLDDNTAYVAYRGTDESIVGWKEDFNMAFISPVPSQERGLDYLNFIGENIAVDLIVGGHSKGGNLAVYAGANCKPQVQEKILAIYDHDGPGFYKEFFQSQGFINIKDKVCKTVPHGSLVGMIFHNQVDFITVKSSAFTVMNQHDAFTWQIKGDCFEETDGLTDTAKARNSSINEWIASMTPAQREDFVNSLFEIFSDAKVDNFFQFARNWPTMAPKAMESFRNTDEETKKMLNDAFSAVFTQATESLTQYTKTSIKDRLQSLEDRLAERKKPSE